MPDYEPISDSRALIPSNRYGGSHDWRGKRKSGFVSSCGKWVFRAALISVLTGAAGFGLLHARLAHSPISLSFVVPAIEKAVNSSIKNMSFEIGDAVLRRSPNQVLGIEFRLAAVRLLDKNGVSVAESPFASGGFSIAALFSGRLAASHIELIGPKLYVHYSDESGVALAFSDPQRSKGDLTIAPARQAQSSQGDDLDQETPLNREVSPAEREGLIRQARGRALNLTKALTKLFDQSRRGESAFMTSFGIEDALVYFDRNGHITRWEVPSVQVNMRHQSEDSAVTGTAAIETQVETFNMSFGAYQNRDTGQISLNLGVEDIIPRAFKSEFPTLKLPEMWNMPVSASATMQLGENGDILTATVLGKLSAGELYAPWEKVHAAGIDEGDLMLTYSREEGLIKLVKSELRWGESRIRMSGFMKRQPQNGRWEFNFSADELVLGARQFGLPTIPLDHMVAEGNYDPAEGAVKLDRFFVQAADAYIALAGRIVHGSRSPAIQVAGQISAMPIAFYKLIWPTFLAHNARDWVGTRMPEGRIAGGTLNIDIPANLLADLNAGGTLPPEAVDFQLDMRDVKMHYIMGLPPMNIAQATMRIAGQRFFFNAPEATVVAPSGETVHFSDGQLIIGDLRPFVPDGEIHFKSESSAAGVLSLLDHPKLGYISKLDMPIPQIDANASSTFSLSIKMVRNLKFDDIKINGRTLLGNVRATDLPGGLGVNGGTLKFDVSSEGIDAEGELKMNSLPILLDWSYQFKKPKGEQPPLILRTVVDEKAREELNIAAPHLLRGPMPVKLTVNLQDTGPPKLNFEANLKDADITAASIGWRKPPGAAAVLNFDLEPIGNGALELRSINLQGDDFHINGALRINGDKKPVAFNFPVVALNSQTQMQILGEINAENLWKIQVRGKSYDGRRFFRSLFSAGKLAVNQPQLPKDAPGLEIDAEFDRVVGFFDTTLDSVKLTASRRQNKLVGLDVYGQLNGKRPFAARMEQKQGEARTLLAQATDAGAAFRLIGLYPSVRGGEASLRVNMDAGDGSQKSGQLFAQSFGVADDQVVEEVLSRPQAARVQQQQLQFDRMQITFSVGGGRFVVRDALINGPLLGATLRGSIDFTNENINLGGTYVPLYGINGALGLVPILGDLLVSRDGEGLFGITFAVRGKTSKPNVLVNPVSAVAPGFLRQLFEFNGEGQPQIAPEKLPRQNGGARSSSLPSSTPQ